MSTLTTRRFLALATELARLLPPDTLIQRNMHGDLAWHNPDGSFGWADLDTGEVHMPDQDAYLPPAPDQG